jgi:dipeptidyl aminopeptidase/acylaminoacyl peptidase
LRIAFIHTDENGESNLYSMRPSGSDIIRLTDFRNSLCGGIAWSHDSQYLGFTSTCEGTLDLYVMKADGSELNRLTCGSERDFQPKWSPDGTRLLFFSTLTPAGGSHTMRMVNLDGSGLRTIGPEADRNAYGAWSPDGSKIAFQSDAFGCSRIGVLDLSTENVNWLTVDERDYWTPVWFPEGDRIACLRSDRGSNRIAILDIEDRNMRILGPEAGLCSGLEITPDGQRILFAHEGPGNPTSLWTQDLDCSPRQLTITLPAGLDEEYFVNPEVVGFTSSDGLEIPALLYRPRHSPSSSLPPAVIRLHGGPNFQTYNCWQPRIQLLVSRGYLVMAPDFRGSTGYGEEFQKRSIGDWGGGDLLDVISAADWLVATEQADPDRIAILGGSYGGYLALMAMAKAPDRWAAGIDLFGFADLETFYSGASDWMRQWIEKQIGSPENNPDFYHDRSPINHCEMIEAPLLVLQGEHDERVPLGQAEQLRDRMMNSGRECRLKVYKGEDHFFGSRETQVDVMQTIVDFLDKHV